MPVYGMKKLSLVFLALIIFRSSIYGQVSSGELISRMDSSLYVLVDLQSKIKDIHPCLNEFHPVAIPYKDSLLIFDFNNVEKSYQFMKETAQPFPLPDGIQASFPLSVYDNKPACIVNTKTFRDTAGYATVLHEFIHCCQSNSVESEIKEGLEIYKAAIRNQDYSWEISHPFPYDDSLFASGYDSYKEALQENKIEKAEAMRNKIRDHLNKIDFEYMVWEEWKEGLARYVENRILDRLHINRNNYGKDKPYNRVSFYYSGELLIGRLTEKNPQLPAEMKKLFEQMRDF